MTDNHDAIKNDPRWHAARADCLDRDDYTCQQCGATEDLTVDHRVPLEVLFAHGITPDAIELALDLANLVCLCRPCNGRKSDRVDPSTVTRHTWISPYYQCLAWLETERETAGVL